MTIETSRYESIFIIKKISVISFGEFHEKKRV